MRSRCSSWISILLVSARISFGSLNLNRFVLDKRAVGVGVFSVLFVSFFGVKRYTDLEVGKICARFG